MQGMVKKYLRSSVSCAGALLVTFMATSLLPMNDVHAQLPPTSICPTAINVYFRVAPPSPPGAINSGAVTDIAIRVLSNFQTWDFIPANIQIGGFSVSMGANSQYIVIPDMFPLQYFPIGQLSAGNYTVTINPVVTSVSPNVACPALTVPLVVAQVFEDVPVPVTDGVWAALLASFAGLVGLAWMSRRRFGR